MSILSDFIGTERKQYTTSGGNYFARSLGEVSRYYEFLLITFNRYEKTSKKFISTVNEANKLRFKLSSPNIIVRMASQAEDIRLIGEINRLTTLCYLEGESFYMFAKIFLDKIPLFIKYYFGESRNISLDSHHKWVTDHEKYLSAKNINYPPGLSKTITSLKKQISDYRDKQITHRKNQGTVLAIGWGVTNEAIMSPYPLSKDAPKVKKTLSDLMQDIDAYIHQLITLIESNRTKRKDKLK